MKPYRCIWIAIVACSGCAGGAEPGATLLSEIPADLTVPAMTDQPPAPGRRVRQVIKAYRDTRIYHCLYLPTDWKKGAAYPVIVEYAGNGPYENHLGDRCTGEVEDCNFGYGISGGEGIIWLCLPYISEDHQHNQLKWWGDARATADYCKAAVAQVCKDFGGDPSAVFIAGFSRGAIACNYIGLYDDEIAALWCGFICHSHYDGVRWDFKSRNRQTAADRLKRLKNRPQFISHERSVEPTRQYLQKACPKGRFTFVVLPYPNHTDTWVLRDIPQRRKLRQWLKSVLKNRTQ